MSFLFLKRFVKLQHVGQINIPFTHILQNFLSETAALIAFQAAVD
jgi:hypothetical protein